MNPRIEIVARAHFDAEVEHLLQHGANTVVMGEREIARTMLELARTNPGSRHLSLISRIRSRLRPASARSRVSL